MPFYLHCLSKACLQKRKEDTGDGYVVSRLGKTCVFSTSVHRHASGDVTYRYLVALLDISRDGGLKKKKKTLKNLVSLVIQHSL